ncbi:19749_t:CDS:1, partial [Cetraspora pellucida]
MSSALLGHSQELVNSKNTQVKTGSPLSIVLTAPQDSEETSSPTKTHHKSKPSLKIQCADLFLSIPTIEYHPPTETCASPAPQQTGFSKYLSNHGGITKSSETTQSADNSLRTLLFRKKLMDDGHGQDEFLFSPIYNHITTRTFLNYEDEDIYSPEISTPAPILSNFNHRTSQDSGVDVNFSGNPSSCYMPPILSSYNDYIGGA